MITRQPIKVEHDRPVLVLGLGQSGVAAARLLLSQGCRVIALDASDARAPRENAAALQAMGVRTLTGARAMPPSGDLSFAVVSPGIPAESAWLEDLRARRIPLISELELGWRSCRSKILAVTGSNGKSTLAVLCHAALRTAGINACIGGNYGEPLCRLVLENPEAPWLVVEVSSFQMETSPAFHPDAGIWLNLLPNHLDRHGDMRTYAALKARMFVNMQPENHAIWFEDAPRLCRDLVQCRGRIMTFGVSNSALFRYTKGQVMFERDGRTETHSIDGSFFDTPMLGPAAAAAMAAATAVGIDSAMVAAVARRMDRLPHRLQPVARIREVLFVNDAKATNLAAMCAALEAVEGPVRLLAGGRLKEKDPATVIESLRNRVVSVYLWGEAAEVLACAWSGAVRCREFSSMESALEAAWHEARAGDVVLLSPGCTSFDQFENFAARGEAFLAAVSRIKEGVGK